MEAPGGYAIWCERSGRLFHTDGAAMQLRAWTPDGGQHRSWRLPEPLYCFALTASRERLLLGLATGLAFLDLNTGLLAPVCDIAPGTRPSDGRCDRQGRFVFGTAGVEEGARGGFWRLHHDLSLERLPLGDCDEATGICFSPNGRNLYYADALAPGIRCCDYHPCSGEITRPRMFAADEAAGAAAVDAEACLWSARKGSRQLRRIAPDGSVERVLALDAPCAGWPVFGGPGLETLYVPASSDEVFCAYRTGVRGLAEERFLGRLPSRA